jgi:thiamine biosynthesis protein ThiS
LPSAFSLELVFVPLKAQKNPEPRTQNPEPRSLNLMSNFITISVNGFMENVPAAVTLSELIDRFEERDVHLIVELNGRFVYPQEYDTIRVAAGDMVEFINPNIGG